MNIEVTQTSSICLDVKGSWTPGEEKNFLLVSDVHWDNPKCKRKLFNKHLEMAKEKNAKMLSFGDFFCFMQGKYDPRSNKSDIRPEHNVKNYLDAVIQSATEELTPYKDQLLLFADGNHETSILNRLETDPTRRLVEGLGKGVYKGGYQGYIRFSFEHESGGSIQSYILYFHHGKWGGVVTKGTLSAARYAAFVPDADLIVSGHTHDKWLMEIPRYRLKRNGKLTIEPQVHLKCGTYKEEFAKDGGWAVERIVTPKSLGGWWLKFEFRNKKIIPTLTMT